MTKSFVYRQLATNLFVLYGHRPLGRQVDEPDIRRNTPTMARPKSNPDPSRRRPTDAECNILSIIWDRGTATVREVYEDLSQRQEVGYTTVLKFMQIMT